MTQRVVLRPHQHPHVQRIMEIWSRHYFALDTSVMGTGKTYTSAYLFGAGGFKSMIVVCPVPAEATWANVKMKYGIPIHIVSLDSLRSVHGKQPKHGLLSRIDHDHDGAGTSFTPTAELLNLVREGVLIVVDEFQHIKNKTAQRSAVEGLVKAVAQAPNQSRVLLTSGSPFDKKEQIVSLFQLLGVIKHHRLYTFHRDEGRLELQGAREFVNYCSAMDSIATRELLSRKPFTKSNIPDVIYDLYVKVLQRYVVSTMPSPVIPADINCANGYYLMSSEGGRKLEEGIRMLHSAARYSSVLKTSNTQEADWGAIQKALQQIEIAKIEIFERKAYEILMNHPTAKVAIFLNFTPPLEYLAARFANFNPLILNGSVDKTKRGDIVAKFQEPTLDYRLIICNMRVGSESISLDDQHGGFPRYAFGSPCYHIVRMHQMTRRFHRDQTKSSATVRFVYGKCGMIETSILSSLTRKNEVLRDTLELQVAEGVLFPGEYPKEEEA